MSTFPARAVVDLDAIAGNVRHLATLAPASQVMAVVKADAYGHGLVPSALAAQAGGATWLGVAQLAEVVRLVVHQAEPWWREQLELRQA